MPSNMEEINKHGVHVALGTQTKLMYKPNLVFILNSRVQLAG